MSATSYEREADLLHDVRLAYGHGDVRLFRNNVGMLPDARGNMVTFGLGKGTSDLIGWQRRVITPSDVGFEWAVFLAIECKRRGQHPTDEQEAFIKQVQTHGGIAGVVRSLEDTHRLLGY